MLRLIVSVDLLEAPFGFPFDELCHVLNGIFFNSSSNFNLQ